MRFLCRRCGATFRDSTESVCEPLCDDCWQRKADDSDDRPSSHLLLHGHEQTDGCCDVPPRPQAGEEGRT